MGGPALDSPSRCLNDCVARYEQAQEWLDRVIRTRKVLRARAA